jgi:hypothetical protein
VCGVFCFDGADTGTGAEDCSKTIRAGSGQAWTSLSMVGRKLMLAVTK